MMSSFEDQENPENPAEPVPDVATTAEPPQPAEPSTEDEALGGEEEAQIDVPVSDNETNNTENSSSTSNSRTERMDKFSQTFVKYAKNLPIRRLCEIINTEIDHENNSSVFYCTSEELLQSFEGGMSSQKKL